MENGQIEFTESNRGKQAFAGAMFGFGGTILVTEIMGFDITSMSEPVFIGIGLVAALIIGVATFMMA